MPIGGYKIEACAPLTHPAAVIWLVRFIREKAKITQILDGTKGANGVAYAPLEHRVEKVANNHPRVFY